MYDVTPIYDYILFLRREQRLSVTLHPLSGDKLIVASRLMTFNIHDNSYCIYVKTFPEAQNHCIACQTRVVYKCQEGAFCGVCYAGVREYVYPILHRGIVKGFISVSGYACDDPKSYIASLSSRFGIPYEALYSVYTTLERTIPPRERVDILLRPLCDMLELAYEKNESEGKREETTMDRALRYLKQYHTQPISLEDICRACACSRSHISHIFRRQMGKSVREYLTELRLEDAKTLLRHSYLGVTEIAFAVGFSDSNYFSMVFKRKTGLSPTAYRRHLQAR